MAHECPECSHLCHCGGDIDDLHFPEPPGEGCSCDCIIRDQLDDGVDWEEEARQREQEEDEEAYYLQHRQERLKEDPPG